MLVEHHQLHHFIKHSMTRIPKFPYTQSIFVILEQKSEEGGY